MAHQVGAMLPECLAGQREGQALAVRERQSNS